MIDPKTFWIVTALLGIGSYLIRYSFIGFWGDRQLPDWAQTHLRYVAASVFPALILPALLWPKATEGEIDPARIVAAVVALLVARTGRVTTAIILGMATLYGVQWALNSLG
ncbi:AzlD domain-containing protein [Albirhodobacter sp. R86504]|uniref:AzlD domain-containing protein n=1 Tax=Albirhodobacter sp. R86504 TaxID=3093848 RepID=UPI00366DEDCF